MVVSVFLYGIETITLAINIKDEVLRSYSQLVKSSGVGKSR